MSFIDILIYHMARFRCFDFDDLFKIFDLKKFQSFRKKKFVALSGLELHKIETSSEMTKQSCNIVHENND